jgi:hypothetical protein
MSLRTTIRAEIKAVWDARWSHGETYRVIWHENAHPDTPTPGEVQHWLHLHTEFSREEMRAFGGGSLANERLWFGAVAVRVFSEVGIGEDVTLDLLDAAVVALRARRAGNLSFTGPIVGIADTSRSNGAWYSRGASIPFQYRFQG